MLAFLHEVGILHDILREKDLLVGLLVHEIEAVLLSIEELVWTTFHIDGLDLGAGGESVLENTSVLKVAELGLHESRTLARLDVLEPHDLARLVVELEIKAVFKISCCCHKLL